jgi:hypothetical protein
MSFMKVNCTKVKVSTRKAWLKFVVLQCEELDKTTVLIRVQ